jgi:hypothetical protein
MINKLLFYVGKNNLNIFNDNVNGIIKIKFNNTVKVFDIDNNVFTIELSDVDTIKIKYENLLFNIYDSEGYSLMFGLCDVYNY